ncbi:MAG: di-trans,poly-cis-decaprenylcistransferase [Puniceicoccales bacterium]|jgi:undecaprenyl diphosphate synthase|nr:di-trans,poly-cis-decaprenylcistransferase [Puniceicoccales bacterium]
MPIEREVSMPEHVAIIMDGNGRWAKARGFERLYGHYNGVKAIKTVIKSARKFGVKFLTLYAFSTENWLRSKHEVSGLMSLYGRAMLRYAKLLVKQNVRFETIGDLEKLPSVLRDRIDWLKKYTIQCDALLLTIALNYGSRDELLRAINRANRAGMEGFSEWSEFEKYLDTNGLPDVDLLIRTSGEQRISNFLLLQSAYAELYFPKKCWPDFMDDDFSDAVHEFQCRKRKFGKVIDAE